MYLINLSSYLYKTYYNISRLLIITSIHNEYFYQLQGQPIQDRQLHCKIWQIHVRNAPQNLEQNQVVREICLLKSWMRST